MSELAALAFRKLVASMRTLEKQYWARRDKGVLRQSIELEKRVDETIMKVEPKNVPQTDNGNFFILVAELRVATKQYFSEFQSTHPRRVWHGGQCGLSTLNDNNDVSNANVNYGAALNFNISQYGVFALRSRQQGQTSPHGETYT